MNLDMVGILQLILFSNKSTPLEVFCKNFTPQSTLPRSVSFVSTITFQNYWFWTIRVCISLTLISENKESNTPNILKGVERLFLFTTFLKGKIHKWRHTILKYYWPPSPFVTLKWVFHLHPHTYCHKITHCMSPSSRLS